MSAHPGTLRIGPDNDEHEREDESMSASSPAQTPGRLAELDIVRGFAVLLVVFYHAVIALPVAGMDVPGWAQVINRAIAPQRMPLLVFLSGMLLPRSLGKPPGRYLVGKLRGIAWPYVVWTTITIALLVGGSVVLGDGNYGGVNGVLGILLDPRTYTWYLAYLMVFYVLALVIPLRVRALLIVPLWLACYLIGDGDGWSRLTSLLACFWMGEIYARRIEVQRFAGRGVVQLVGGLILAAVTLGAVWGLPVRYTIWSFFGLVGSFLVILPAARAAQHSFVGRGIAAVGRDSIVYYLTHWPVVTVLVHLVDRIGISQSWLALLVLMAGGLGASAVAHWLRTRVTLVGWLYAWAPALPSPATAHGGSR